MHLGKINITKRTYISDRPLAQHVSVNCIFNWFPQFSANVTYVLKQTIPTVKISVRVGVMITEGADMFRAVCSYVRVA